MKEQLGKFKHISENLDDILTASEKSDSALLRVYLKNILPDFNLEEKNGKALYLKLFKRQVDLLSIFISTDIWATKLIEALPSDVISSISRDSVELFNGYLKIQPVF